MRVLLVVLLAMAPVLADDFPQTEISNGIVKAKLYLPDAEKGYYRATRFDWAGQIPSLQVNGHEYFGVWNQRPYSPKVNDAITGPVEEFVPEDELSALGYGDAKVGGTFVRIGVGVLRKAEDRKFERYRTYDIVDPGKWTVKKRPDAVEFHQEAGDLNSGYAWNYTKVVKLVKGKPEMVLEHRLKNTGNKVIETEVYDHNFYMLDHQPTGPDIVVHFPFAVQAKQAWQPGTAEIRGNEVHYLKELAVGETASNELAGFSSDPKDYRIEVENRKTGAGVRQTSDRPITRIVYWSIRPTACPEAYIQIRVEPGKTFTWKIHYEFYTVAAQN